MPFLLPAPKMPSEKQILENRRSSGAALGGAGGAYLAAVWGVGGSCCVHRNPSVSRSTTMDPSLSTLVLCNVQVLLADESTWKVFPEGEKFEHYEIVHIHCFCLMSQNSLMVFHHSWYTLTQSAPSGLFVKHFFWSVTKTEPNLWKPVFLKLCILVIFWAVISGFPCKFLGGQFIFFCQDGCFGSKHGWPAVCWSTASYTQFLSDLE